MSNDADISPLIEPESGSAAWSDEWDEWGQYSSEHEQLAADVAFHEERKKVEAALPRPAYPWTAPLVGCIGGIALIVGLLSVAEFTSFGRITLIGTAACWGYAWYRLRRWEVLLSQREAELEDIEEKLRKRALAKASRSFGQKRAHARRRKEKSDRELAEFLLDYFDPSVIERIMRKEVWVGQPERALRIARGEPSAVVERILKTKTKATYKYDPISKSRFRTHIDPYIS